MWGFFNWNVWQMIKLTANFPVLVKRQIWMEINEIGGDISEGREKKLLWKKKKQESGFQEQHIH